MIEFTTATRPRPARVYGLGTSAKYKLQLKLPGDRKAAAELLWEARKINQRCAWRPATSWRMHLDVAASFALQQAEVASEEQDHDAERVYDHIAYIMESTSDLRALRGDWTATA